MRALLVVVWVIVPAAAAGEPPTRWHDYTSKEGRFAVSFPGPPKEERHTVKTPAGPLTTTTVIARLNRAAVCTVAYHDVSDAAVKASTADQRLNLLRDGAVQSLQGKLLSEKKVERDRFPGRELLIELPDQAVYRTRVYVAGARVYQVVVKGPPEAVTSQEADRFLDSFHIKP
jgi:hypothetical protein